MSKITISFDLDGTLADWYKKYKRVAEECYPQYGTLPDSVDWNQSNWPLRDVEHTILRMTWMGMPNFYQDLELCEGVNTKFLAELSRCTNLIFTTSRHEHPQSASAHSQSVHWIKRMIEISDPVVVVANDKGPVLRAAQALVHVDDAVHVLDSLNAHRRLHGCGDRRCAVTQGLLIEHVQNRGYTTNTFAEVMALINSVLWSHNVKPVSID